MLRASVFVSVAAAAIACGAAIVGCSSGNSGSTPVPAASPTATATATATSTTLNVPASGGTFALPTIGGIQSSFTIGTLSAATQLFVTVEAFGGVTTQSANRSRVKLADTCGSAWAAYTYTDSTPIAMSAVGIEEDTQQMNSNAGNAFVMDVFEYPKGSVSGYPPCPEPALTGSNYAGTVVGVPAAGGGETFPLGGITIPANTAAYFYVDPYEAPVPLPSTTASAQANLSPTYGARVAVPPIGGYSFGDGDGANTAADIDFGPFTAIGTPSETVTVTYGNYDFGNLATQGDTNTKTVLAGRTVLGEYKIAFGGSEYLNAYQWGPVSVGFNACTTFCENGAIEPPLLPASCETGTCHVFYGTVFSTLATGLGSSPETLNYQLIVGTYGLNYFSSPFGTYSGGPTNISSDVDQEWIVITN